MQKLYLNTFNTGKILIFLNFNNNFKAAVTLTLLVLKYVKTCINLFKYMALFGIVKTITYEIKY